MPSNPSGTRSGSLRKGQSPCLLLGILSGFLYRRCRGLRSCVYLIDRYKNAYCQLQNPIKFHPYVSPSLTYSQVRLETVSFLFYWGKNTEPGIRVCLLEAGHSAHSPIIQETWDTSHAAVGWVHDCFTDFPLQSTPESTLGSKGLWWRSDSSNGWVVFCILPLPILELILNLYSIWLLCLYLIWFWISIRL